MRVQIPAYHDAWMKGDRYGNVVKITNAKPHLARQMNGQTEIAHVLLDKSNKVVRVHLADCEVV